MIGTPCPKPRPIALTRREQRAALATLDKRESAFVRKRSAGRCEVVEVDTVSGERYHCVRAGREVHHLIGGWGRRNRGNSILAAYKLHVCHRHHSDITHHLLVPRRAEATAATITYRRV